MGIINGQALTISQDIGSNFPEFKYCEAWSGDATTIIDVYSQKDKDFSYAIVASSNNKLITLYKITESDDEPYFSSIEQFESSFNMITASKIIKKGDNLYFCIRIQRAESPTYHPYRDEVYKINESNTSCDLIVNFDESYQGYNLTSFMLINGSLHLIVPGTELDPYTHINTKVFKINELSGVVSIAVDTGAVVNINDNQLFYTNGFYFYSTKNTRDEYQAYYYSVDDDTQQNIPIFNDPEITTTIYFMTQSKKTNDIFISVNQNNENKLYKSTVTNNTVLTKEIECDNSNIDCNSYLYSNDYLIMYSKKNSSKIGPIYKEINNNEFSIIYNGSENKYEYTESTRFSASNNKLIITGINNTDFSHTFKPYLLIIDINTGNIIETKNSNIQFSNRSTTYISTYNNGLYYIIPEYIKEYSDPLSYIISCSKELKIWYPASLVERSNVLNSSEIFYFSNTAFKFFAVGGKDALYVI